MTTELPKNRLDENAGGISRLETENRLLFSLLKPVIRFARRCRIPLDRLVELTTLAYYKDLRSRGLTVRESASILGKSIRTVTAISQRVKGRFFAPESEHGLPRRIEYHLAIAPMTLPELMEALGADKRAAIDKALDTLLRDRRVVAEHRSDGGTLFRVASGYADLNLSSWERRIDALNHLGEATLDTVISRLQENDPDAFARVFTFSAKSAPLMSLREQVYEILRAGTSGIEEQATEDGVADGKFHIVFCVSPAVVDTDLQPSGAARKSRKPKPS